MEPLVGYGLFVMDSERQVPKLDLSPPYGFIEPLVGYGLFVMDSERQVPKLDLSPPFTDSWSHLLATDCSLWILKDKFQN